MNKPEKWIRSDLQDEYERLVNEQQPLLGRHRELCEKLREEKDEKIKNEVFKIREKIEDLEKRKNTLWNENLDTFHSIWKKS